MLKPLWEAKGLWLLFVLMCAVFQYDPGFQEDPSQPFSDSDDDINDTDG